jgi:hypothetical protein
LRLASQDRINELEMAGRLVSPKLFSIQLKNWSRSSR